MKKRHKLRKAFKYSIATVAGKAACGECSLIQNAENRRCSRCGVKLVWMSRKQAAREGR